MARSRPNGYRIEGDAGIAQAGPEPGAGAGRSNRPSATRRGQGGANGGEPYTPTAAKRQRPAKGQGEGRHTENLPYHGDICH